MTMTRTYEELLSLETFEERYRYLQLNGKVAGETFGFERFLNQNFYTSLEWRSVRDFVKVRDDGCDLAVRGRDISGRLIVHHMNPIRPDDLYRGNSDILNPDFLILVSHNTHNAIHYGDTSLLTRPFEERKPGDTILW